MYKKIVKPFFDFFGALLGLLFLSPLLLLTWIALSLANKGKPFFYQLRPGKNEKLFKIIKFKTMTDCKNISGDLLPDAERLTKVGNFIRKTSLDEIPQLINVLKGDMSLIGPRPLLPEYLPLYNAKQRKRHQLKPGITGWAQINGRNTISWDQKFGYDVWYINNLSFLLDIKIILITVKNVLLRQNISPLNDETMPKFSNTINK